MNNRQRVVAGKFAIYNGLPLFDQWRLRRALKWISTDAASLQVLLNLEDKLRDGPLSGLIIELLLSALKWYNREVHDQHLKDRLPPNRLPGFLQIVLAFVEKSQTLHSNYRGLILNILSSGDTLGLDHHAAAGLTPERFRLEVSESIANLGGHSHGWDRWHPRLETAGNLLLRHFAAIAGEIGDPQLFAQYRLEAAKALSQRVRPAGDLGYLENIASKVKDRESFLAIFGTVVPAIGLEAAANLIAISTDLQEFDGFYRRAVRQSRRWGREYLFLFSRTKSASQVNRQLVILETLPRSARLTRYFLYMRTHHSGTLRGCLWGELQAHKGYVFQECLKLDWTGEPEVGPFVESQIDQFEQRIVRVCLDNIWQSTFNSPEIRWQFDTFTEYIPYAIKDWDWTRDDAKVRSYWNSREGERREYDRYIGELRPRLLALLHELDLSAMELVFNQLPGYLGIQKFTKTVSIPLEWRYDIEYQEGYNKWDGHYTEKVEVARPIRFTIHDFEFDRPYLQNAIDFLDSVENHGVI